MYEDPRDDLVRDSHDVLTEDSDDALADLEKEFAVKRQKLLEERARKRELAETKLQVERSPSPKRAKKYEEPSQSSSLAKQIIVQPSRSEHDAQVVAKPPRIFQKVASGSSDQFAERLFQNEKQLLSVNYKDRFFEFENIPERTSVPLAGDNEKETASGAILRRRYIEELHVTRLLTGVKILRVSKLLAKVCSPQFLEPDYTNWCFAGIILYKSDPRKASNGAKYMTLRIGDFHHTVDVYLFGNAFQKFWKLSCGSVVVILNPTVKKYGSGFSLHLLDGINNVLEIGALKHYGYCSATNKQGERCKFVIDLLRNELCSYHEESKFKHGSRMELQGSVKPKAPKNKQGIASQAFVNRSNSLPLFIQYENAGFQEKDIVYSGGKQFDESRYDRPVKESEAAKLRKRKANERLRMQLINNAPPSRLNDLDKLGIVQQNQLEIAERQNSLLEIRQQAFKNKFLTGMGYDPTFEKSQRLDKVKPTQSMEELRLISKNKRVSLKASEEEKRKKLERQKSAMRIIKPGPSPAKVPGAMSHIERKSLDGNLLRCDKSTLNENEKACENDVCVENADSDSDIEISFTSDADKVRYKNAIASPAP